MKKNIAIVCQKHDYAKQVAQMLAERLEMNWFDVFDMLLFDDKPHTLEQTINIIGEKNIRKHETSIIKYSVEFSNTIIVCEGGAVECKKNWDYLLKNCLVVYLHCSIDRVLEFNNKIKYNNNKEKAFFLKSKERYLKRIDICKKRADIVVNCTRKSAFLSTSLVIRSIIEWDKKSNIDN